MDVEIISGGFVRRFEKEFNRAIFVYWCRGVAHYDGRWPVVNVTGGVHGEGCCYFCPCFVIKGNPDTIISVVRIPMRLKKKTYYLLIIRS